MKTRQSTKQKTVLQQPNTTTNKQTNIQHPQQTNNIFWEISSQRCFQSYVTVLQIFRPISKLIIAIKQRPKPKVPNRGLLLSLGPPIIRTHRVTYFCAEQKMSGQYIVINNETYVILAGNMFLLSNTFLSLNI